MTFSRILLVVVSWIVWFVAGSLLTAIGQAAGLLPSNAIVGNGVPLLFACGLVWLIHFRRSGAMAGKN